MRFLWNAHYGFPAVISTIRIMSAGACAKSKMGIALNKMKVEFTAYCILQGNKEVLIHFTS